MARPPEFKISETPKGWMVATPASMGWRGGGDEERETFRDRYWRAVAAMEMEWSDRYAIDMGRLPRWVPGWFMDLAYGSITRPVMESALTEVSKVARSTIDNRARYLSAIIGHRERHRKTTEIAILDRPGVAKCLQVCENREERRVVATLFFAGARPDSEFGEISRLDWEAFGEEEIYISRHSHPTGWLSLREEIGLVSS